MYVITGATGNTGKRISEILLTAGKPVTAIARNVEKLADLQEKGANTLAADLSDQAQIIDAFRGAQAVYLMIPPIWNTSDWRASIRQQAHILANAVRDSGVKKVILLSSMGAHRTEGNGPIGGLGEFENAIRTLPGVDVLALRPAYFMENTFASVGMIQQAGINGGVQKADISAPLIHTSDVATVAAQRLLDLSFSGFSHEFIVGPSDLTMLEVTTSIGEAIGKPALPYIEFSSADGKAGMVQAGLPETIAQGYVEMAEATNNGNLFEGYDRSAATVMPTSWDWFLENQLKHAFNQQ
jgi:uncharacterized protein YbjT (DUF2867 family)